MYENNSSRFFFDIFILPNVLDVCGKFQGRDKVVSLSSFLLNAKYCYLCWIQTICISIAMQYWSLTFSSLSDATVTIMCYLIYSVCYALSISFIFFLSLLKHYIYCYLAKNYYYHVLYPLCSLTKLHLFYYINCTRGVCPVALRFINSKG